MKGGDELREWVIVAVLGVCSAVVGLGGDTHRTESAAGEVLQTSERDLDRDGVLEKVKITCARREDGRPLGGEIVVMQAREGKMTTVWRVRNLNPWKLRIADVDGDGEMEIVTGVWKKSPKDPVMAQRVFVWSWNGERMLPKWLGSRLSRRFEDFEFRDINHDGWDELLALEVAPGKPKRVGMYRWRSFGFDWLGSAEPERWRELTR